MEAGETRGALRRYTLLQLPGAALLALALWYGVEREWLSTRVAVLVWVAWVVKDALLYPALRLAYLPDRDDPGATLRGKPGVARDPVPAHPGEGYVHVGPELWRAIRDDASPPIDAGDAVRVRDVRGMRLVVERIPDPGVASSAADPHPAPGRSERRGVSG